MLEWWQLGDYKIVVMVRPSCDNAIILVKIDKLFLNPVRPNTEGEEEGRITFILVTDY